MKNLRQIARYLLIGYTIVLLGLFPFLPNEIPMQYSITGSVNYTFPKFLALLVMFALNLVVVLVLDQKTKNEDYPSKHLVTQATLIIVTLAMLIKNLF